VGRVLVVGCGWISHQVHLPLLAGMRADGQVGELWVSDLDRSLAAQTARTFGARLAEDGADGLAADLTVVATTPGSHAEITVEALEYGADVVVEKPLALTAADSACIARACAATGRRVFPLYIARHRADVEVMRSILAADRGWAHTLHLSWLRAAGLPATRGGREAGVLWDLGSHPVDTGLHVTGWLPGAGSPSRKRPARY
jgi:predicted dehydrogenase